VPRRPAYMWQCGSGLDSGFHACAPQACIHVAVWQRTGVVGAAGDASDV